MHHPPARDQLQRSRTPQQWLWALVVASCLVLAALAGPARAQAATAEAVGEASLLGQVAAWPLWVEAGRGLSVTVLAADGSLTWLDGATPAAAPVRLARGLAGEQLAACGAALLVVDGRGALRRVPRAPDLPVVSVVGPLVSRYHKPVCTADGSVIALDPQGAVLLLSRELEPRARADVAALPDAELVLLELPDVTVVAVLSEPTQRYRHGTLGDEVEAAALTLLRLPDLTPLATWRPAAPAVIEARRPTPWHADGAVGLHVTVSDEASGARLVSLVWGGSALKVLASGEPLGASQRWLHLIGANGPRVYAVHEPRAGGPLVRYELSALDLPPADATRDDPPTTLDDLSATRDAPATLDDAPARLVTSAFDLDLVSHVDGERLLDRAALLGSLPDGADLLLVPRRHQRTLVWLRCDAVCSEIAEVTLPAALATNLSLSPAQGPATAVVLADRAGTVWRLPLPTPLADEATLSEHRRR